MAVLGKNTVGGSSVTYGGSGEEYICVKFTTTEAGTTDDIKVYTRYPYGSGQACSFAIFSHDSVNNRPLDELVKVTGTYDNTLAWYTAAITYAFASGETLWLCFWPSAHADVYYDSGGTNQTWRKYANVTYNTFEDPFTTTDSTGSNEEYSIYVNYTASGGSGTKRLGLLGVG